MLLIKNSIALFKYWGSFNFTYKYQLPEGKYDLFIIPVEKSVLFLKNFASFKTLFFCTI